MRSREYGSTPKVEIIMTWPNSEVASDLEWLYCNIIWHNMDRVFEPCQRNGTSQAEYSDLVQVLLPSKFHRKILLANTLVDLEDCSAVIFGHNLKLKWYWEDVGDPREGDLPWPSKHGVKPIPIHLAESSRFHKLKLPTI